MMDSNLPKCCKILHLRSSSLLILRAEKWSYSCLKIYVCREYGACHFASFRDNVTLSFSADEVPLPSVPEEGPPESTRLVRKGGSMKTPRKNSLFLLAIVALAIPAFGQAVFTLGNHPQPNEENVLFPTDQTKPAMFGFTNQSSTQVQFSSTTDTLVVLSHSQANVSASDGLVNVMTFTVPGHTFAGFIFNPFKPANNSDLNIVVTMSDGFTPDFGPYGSTNGNNFLTITTTGGEMIKSVTVD